MKMKNISSCSVLIIALFLSSGCATKTPVQTTTDVETGGVYTGEDHRYKTTAVMEFYKKTNKSLSHNSGLALAVGSEISNALRRIGVNIAYPSVVTSEFTARGEINMIYEGGRIAKLEKKDLVLFLDVQTHKREKTYEKDRVVRVSIGAWIIDALKKKIIFKLHKKGKRVLTQDSRLADIDDALREVLIDTAGELGEEVARLLEDYLSAV